VLGKRTKKLVRSDQLERAPRAMFEVHKREYVNARNIDLSRTLRLRSDGETKDR
jgi:hypothetical protein